MEKEFGARVLAVLLIQRLSWLLSSFFCCCCCSVFIILFGFILGSRVLGKMPCSEVTDATVVSPVKKSRTEEIDEKRGNIVLKFAKLSEHATAPTRGSAKAAGYDLYR